MVSGPSVQTRADRPRQLWQLGLPGRHAGQDVPARARRRGRARNLAQQAHQPGILFR